MVTLVETISSSLLLFGSCKTMKVRCSCGATYNVPENYAGRKVKCKRSKESFIAGGGAGQPATGPRKRKKKQPSKSEREDALLKKYSTGSNLEERMAQRQRDTIESERTSNGILFILKGFGYFLLAAFVFWALSEIGAGRRIRLRGILAILFLLRFLMAQYWLPPLIVLYGIYVIYIGIMSLLKKVDIVTQDQLPQI